MVSEPNRLDLDEVLSALSIAFPSVNITKKVLARPPFSFLHKLCDEALAPQGIFAQNQLSVGHLVSREQKV